MGDGLRAHYDLLLTIGAFDERHEEIASLWARRGIWVPLEVLTQAKQFVNKFSPCSANHGRPTADLSVHADGKKLIGLSRCGA